MCNEKYSKNSPPVCRLFLSHPLHPLVVLGVQQQAFLLLHSYMKCRKASHESFSCAQSFRDGSTIAACAFLMLTACWLLAFFVSVFFGLCLLETSKLLILLLAALLPQQQLWMERGWSWPTLDLVRCGRNYRCVQQATTSFCGWSAGVWSLHNKCNIKEL